MSVYELFECPSYLYAPWPLCFSPFAKDSLLQFSISWLYWLCNARSVDFRMNAHYTIIFMSIYLSIHLPRIEALIWQRIFAIASPTVYGTVCHLLCVVITSRWTRSSGAWKLICLNSNERHSVSSLLFCHFNNWCIIWSKTSGTI